MIEKIIARLREKVKYNSEQAEIWREGSDKDAYFREKKDLYLDRANTYGEAIRIVQEVAKEYGDGWIPCEIALPKEATTYEVTCEIILCSEKQYITTYALWGTEGEWICRKNERVIAWKEKSAPYQRGE